MQYKLTQEQELLQGTIRDFAQSEISPLASKVDWEARMPNDLLSKLPNMGVYGITIPSEYGGAGADFLSLVVAIEELSKASGSLAAQLSLHNAVVCEALIASANAELKTRLLPRLSAGTFGAFSLDPKSTITGRNENQEIVLEGSSEYVMSASSATIFLVFARINNGGKVMVAFSKDEIRDSSSFAVGEPRKMLGLRASGTTKITLDRLRLPVSSQVFEPRSTPAALNDLLARARLAVAAQALGIAQASLDEETRYANERTQFSTKIGKFYAVQDFIAMDEIAIETSRAMTYGTASQLTTLQTLQRDSSIAKVSASNSAVQAARHSIRVHGGYGFLRDYPVERYLRDARATQLYLESNEELKAKIAGSLLAI